MPVCEGCGGSYDDEFNYCPYCARANPKPSPIEINVNVSDSTVWETCQIFLGIFKHGKENDGWFRDNNIYSELYLWAEAKGPSGTYCAGESRHFEGSPKDRIEVYNYFYQKRYEKNYHDYDDARSELIAKLVLDGWTQIQDDPIMFRRQVKKP